MNDELKPCPFCGDIAILEESSMGINPILYYVSCINCKATMEFSDNKKEAIEVWNNRYE